MTPGSINRGTLRDRFYARATVRDGCWGWRGHVGVKGYTTMQVGGRPLRGHRVSWEVHHGPIPDGLNVLHRCDNPACVNPDHLFLGTHADNVHDMVNKGRLVVSRGEDSGGAKLTAADVLAIRAHSGHRGHGVALARRYGVSPALISMVRSGRIWTHVQGAA